MTRPFPFMIKMLHSCHYISLMLTGCIQGGGKLDMIDNTNYVEEVINSQTKKYIILKMN